MKKVIDVVGAVILNQSHQVLCALRSPSMSLPNLWEFPGGKIEPGEAPVETLAREIVEELGCVIEVTGPVEDTMYEYEKVTVRLRTFYALITMGEATPKEHAELRWLPVEQLENLVWAPADIPAVEKLIREHSP